jgi:hypothetical protein
MNRLGKWRIRGMDGYIEKRGEKTHHKYFISFHPAESVCRENNALAAERKWSQEMPG